MKKKSPHDSYLVLCSFCEHPNDVYRVKCKICGRNLNACMGVIDRRSKADDLSEEERETYVARSRKVLKRVFVPRRKSPRISVSLFPCKLSAIGKTTKNLNENHATVLDITSKGILIKTRMDLAKGTRVQIEFQLPNSSKPISVKGKLIRKVILGKEAGWFGAALVYVDTTPKHQGKISKFINSFVEGEERCLNNGHS